MGRETKWQLRIAPRQGSRGLKPGSEFERATHTSECEAAKRIVARPRGAAAGPMPTSTNVRLADAAHPISHRGTKPFEGKDIVAIAPSGQKLWISAKGYPVGTVKTNPRTQARHWFAHALFDLLLWHGEETSIAIGLALPEYQTYRSLAPSITRL